MLRSRIFKSFVSSQHKRCIIFRAMATKLKDYVSYYDILEIHPECTKTEIREAWLKMSMLYHPDLNKGNPDANDKFMEVKEAYTTLINDDKRKAYNDKIGFYHSDPPPDFKREWTFQGEMERSGANTYHVMWSEEAIRRLMSSDKLRDMNWHKMPPSERYKVLEEEKKKQFAEKVELERTDTLSLRYWVMFASVLLVCVFTKLLERSGGGDEEDKLNGGYQSRKKFLEEAYSKKDVVTEGGQLIHFTARTDLEEFNNSRTIFDDPKKPGNYYGEAGWREGLPVPAQRTRPKDKVWDDY